MKEFPELTRSEQHRDGFLSHESEGGMSLLDYFAGQAMQGFLSSLGQHDATDYSEIVHDSYLMASKMLEERKKYE